VIPLLVVKDGIARLGGCSPGKASGTVLVGHERRAPLLS